VWANKSTRIDSFNYGDLKLLDFTELSADGQDLELLVRELLFRQGFSVYWSGKGADGGRDLVCIERRASFFQQDERSWLIQCKHNANSGKSVSVSDLDGISDSCAHHNCQGYLLVCSTHPSSGVVNRLEGISKNLQKPIVASYWDSVKLEQLLSTPKNWSLAQRFFPISASAEDWQIYATDAPNQWVVTYKGYYFHLKNRIGSRHTYHLKSIKKRITDIEGIALPEKHFLRPRSVYYDDKNGGYEWYVDYMYPNAERAIAGSAQIANELGDGYALEDGQWYTFHVSLRSYLEHSDHYDPDHYDYYDSSSIPRNGGARSYENYEDYAEAADSKIKLIEDVENEKNRGFDKLCKELEQISFIKVIRKSNSQIENLDKFYIQKNWSEIIEELGLEDDRFFSAWFFIKVTDGNALHDLVTNFPQSVDKHFRLTRPHIYLPAAEPKRSVRGDTDILFYELTLSIHPSTIGNKVMGRSLLNEYFEELAHAVAAFRLGN